MCNYATVVFTEVKTSVPALSANTFSFLSTSSFTGSHMTRAPHKTKTNIRWITKIDDIVVCKDMRKGKGKESPVSAVRNNLSTIRYDFVRYFLSVT